MLNGYDTERVSGDVSNEEALGEGALLSQPWSYWLHGLLSGKQEGRILRICSLVYVLLRCTSKEENDPAPASLHSNGSCAVCSASDGRGTSPLGAGSATVCSLATRGDYYLKLCRGYATLSYLYLLFLTSLFVFLSCSHWLY